MRTRANRRCHCVTALGASKVLSASGACSERTETECRRQAPHDGRSRGDKVGLPALYLQIKRNIRKENGYV